MHLIIWRNYQQIQLLPALWAEQGTCEGCGRDHVSLNLCWLFWGIGIGGGTGGTQ